MVLGANPRDIRDNVGSFGDRDSYIQKRCGEQLDPNRLSLCNVLAASTDSAGATFPWITPVLGSGATSDAQTRFVAERRAEEAAVVVGRELGIPAYSKVVTAFSQSLIDDRLSSSSRLPGAGYREPESDGRASERGSCLLAVALLTQAYYGLRAYTSAPVSRGRTGEVSLTMDSDQGVLEPQEFKAAVLEPAFDALERASALSASSTSRDVGGAKKIMDRAMDRLSPSRRKNPSVSLLDVHLLTEYAWHLISESLYPGWSDLLWSLFMSGQGWPPEDDGQGPRPITINLDSAEKSLKEGFKDKADASWLRYKDGLRSGSEIYQRVAGLLVAQSAVRSGWKKDPGKPPVAAAFVATFDLELELALLSQSQPFVVALPVTVATTTGTSAYAWIGYKVVPDGKPDSLDAVLEPDHWFVLSNNRGYPRQELSNLPTVVRLTGSPLVELPADLPHRLGNDLGGVLGRRGDADDGAAVLAISHAVLLDEFAALAQSTNAMRVEAAQETKNRRWPGLPNSITGSMNADYTRFWMMLGVQTGDAAIRQTVAGFLARLHATSRIHRPGLLRNGIAVNEWIAGEAEDLMLWSGLDVVRTSCEEFGPDLAHYYAKHLQGGEVHSLPANAVKSCRLLTEGESLWTT